MKLKNAPFTDKQPQGKPYEVYIIAGSQAWNKTKWQAVNEWTKAGSDYQPLVLGSPQLEELKENRLKIAVDVGKVSIFEAGKLTRKEKNAINESLAVHSTNTTTAFYNEALELIENSSERVNEHRKQTASTHEVSKEEYANYFKTLADNERVSAFMAWYGKPLRLNDTSERIYTYTGKKWQMLKDSELKRLIRNFFNAHCIKYSKRRLDAIFDLISYEVELMGKADPLLLAFNNGTLNKQTRVFSPLNEMDFLTSYLDVDYDEKQTVTPNFDKWLHFVSQGNADKAEVILASLYMILTNRYDWQMFVEITGVGGGGKSIFNEIAILLSGRDNTSQISLRELENPVIRCKILDKTLIYSADQEAYIGDGAELRAITGGDAITFNPKYAHAFDEQVKAVYMLTNNEAIIFKEHNGGISRRRVIIHFGQAVPPKMKDTKLKDKLAQELGGIINKLLDRFSHNPQEAQSLLEAQRYSAEAISIKKESNHVLDFAQHFTARTEINGLIMGSTKQANTTETAKKYLYGAYLFYCECENIPKPLRKKTFKIAFESAMKELQQSGIKTRLRDGREVTNIYYLNFPETLSLWQS